MDKLNGKRIVTQLLATFFTNANLIGFFQGNIYKGNLKAICVPGLNCYSCPGATGSCPIGAIQSILGSRKYDFAFYGIGFLLLFSALFGRFICGWLCVFGFIQDLLYKIPTPKIKVNPKVDHLLRYLKYGVLVVFVIILPMFWVNEFGISAPYFCKYICPVGIFEGGIPLVLKNESLRSTIGLLFGWKLLVLIVILLSSVLTYRPFCKYICPLGAFYALFNKMSMVGIEVGEHDCNHCGKCATVCKMDVEVFKEPNSRECIRCGDCIESCPNKALKMGFKIRP